MNNHIAPSNVLSRELPPLENGLRLETPTVYAATPELLDAACVYYAQVSRSGMGIGARLDRVIALRANFGAQTRHAFS